MDKGKVLITGGAGFIGSHLCQALLSRGYRITVLDNLLPQVHGENAEQTSGLFLSITNEIKFIKGSVTDYTLLKEAVSDHDFIIHLAAETGTGQSMYEISRYNEVNIQGTANLLDVLANYKNTVKKVLVASSRAIYGEGKYVDADGTYHYPLPREKSRLEKGDFELYAAAGRPLSPLATDEMALIHPTSVYGITKHAQEQLVMTVCPTLGIAPVAFRYQNVYGPGQSLSNPYTGILSIFSNQILQGLSINIFEDGKESRDFVYIDDVVDATVQGLENDAANEQVFNVGAGLPTSVYDVAKSLMRLYGKEVLLRISGNYRLGDIRHNFADISKISNMLGFKPKVGFEEGLQYFTSWVKEQTIVENAYERSLAEMQSKGMFKQSLFKKSNL